MGFGVSKIFRLLSPHYYWHTYKRSMVYKRNKGKNLKMLLGCNINNVSFGQFVFLGKNVTLSNVKIGDHSYINSYSQIRDTKIGKFCSIASNVRIVLGNHPTNFISLHPAFYANNKAFYTYAKEMHYDEEFKEVIIGNDVWIGDGVLITGGIKIGDGAIVAARSVVTKDVEPYSVVGGIPAKIIKKRFNDSEINQLLNLKWWDKDENWLKENYKLFLNTKAFFDTCKP